MLDFITKFFKREEASKTLAKERLRLVLMSDRVSLAPDVFDEMKGEMLSVIRRYLEIDERALDMHFENLERQFALLASIPVLKVKTAEEVAAASHHGTSRNGTSRNGAGHNGAPHNGAVADGIIENGIARTQPPRRRRRRKRAASPPLEEGAPPSQNDGTSPHDGTQGPSIEGP